MAAKKKRATKKRTTHRSGAGKKLYAERAKGKFEDIQSYKRAHGSDVKRVSKAETAARTKAGKPAPQQATYESFAVFARPSLRSLRVRYRGHLPLYSGGQHWGGKCI